VATTNLAWDWPFSNAQLTAGVRRYFTDASLQVSACLSGPVSFLPAEGQGEQRGLQITYHTPGGPDLPVACMLKQPRRATRRGLAGVGVREAGVYRSLSSQLAFATPAVIAADPAGSWLVLEAVESTVAPGAWTADLYVRAVRELAAMHERFWDLAEDLSVYDWLTRLLTHDFDIYALGAVNAVERMMVDDRPQLITASTETLNRLGQLLTQVERIGERLRAVPSTLLHGDFRPRNLAVNDDGDFVAYGWGMAAVGPGLLDMLVFTQSIAWEGATPPVRPETLWRVYRDEIGQRLGLRWSDEEFAELLDYALMWYFIQEQLEYAASAPPARFDPVVDRFERLWLAPALDAARRRLGPVLYQ
jgi:hypothetical protein